MNTIYPSTLERHSFVCAFTEEKQSLFDQPFKVRKTIHSHGQEKIDRLIGVMETQVNASF